MVLSEFEIIKRFFQRDDARADVALGVGDDAACLRPPVGAELVVATDTLVNGVHFPNATSARDIGFKSLAVNLSDIAAMGARPAWATLALTVPQASEPWLAEFANGFFELATRHDVALVGGDLTRGSLSITVQLIGTVASGRAVTRGGGKVGDDVYVTGTLGDARLALEVIGGRITPSKIHDEFLRKRLNRPCARVAVGCLLTGIASCAIDVSDGLAADLKHLLESSGVGMELIPDALPRSAALSAVLSERESLAAALAGGDDYELCFSAPVGQRQHVTAIALKCACPIARIGVLIEGNGIRYANGKRLEAADEGYRHF